MVIITMTKEYKEERRMAVSKELYAQLQRAGSLYFIFSSEESKMVGGSWTMPGPINEPELLRYQDEVFVLAEAYSLFT
jgi:hypothetical protein